MKIPFQNPRILFADDDHTAQHMVRIYLGRSECEVTIIKNIESLRKQIADGLDGFDIIAMDGGLLERGLKPMARNTDEALADILKQVAGRAIIVAIGSDVKHRQRLLKTEIADAECEKEDFGPMVLDAMAKKAA